jgi:hypothetical protein
MDNTDNKDEPSNRLNTNTQNTKTSHLKIIHVNLK